VASSAQKKGAAALGFGALLLLLLGLGGEEEGDEEEEDLDEPGTPGGQEPTSPFDEPIPAFPQEPFEPTVYIPMGPQTPGGDFPFAPFVPGEGPWNPGVWEHPSNYPSPGTFHQVESGDIFFGKGSRHNLAWAVLYEAAYQAAMEIGGTDDQGARTFAKQIADKGANRIRYTDLILCSPFNDLLYGTWGYGEKSHPGPHGRSIRMLPYHAGNRELIFQRQPPVRNIEMLTPAAKNTGSAGPISSEYRETWEYLWLPPINLQALWNDRRITTEGLAWDDGSSMLYPPPEIWALGIDVLEDPGLSSYGCEQGETSMEEV